MAALVARLRTRKPAVHLHHRLPVQRRLVLENLPEPPQPQLAYRLGEMAVLHHPRDVEVLDDDDVVLGKEGVHDAV